MKPLLCVLSVVLAFGGLGSQTHIWQPSAGHVQVAIWPGTPPDAQPVPGTEYVETTKDEMVAGKPYVWVSNITRPTMTVYSPKGKNTGVAVVVFPGGGFEGLAIDLEGTEVCDWLTSEGITCVLLKYRVPSLPYDWHCKCRPNDLATSTLGLEDAQRTMGLARFHAAEWHIDLHKIGVLGFSAGGYLVAEISTQSRRRLYASVDAADRESCRPDFAVGVYPGHLRVGTHAYKLNPKVPVTQQTPPTFFGAGGGRQCGRGKPISGLLHCAKERGGSRGDAFVRAGRACVRAAAHEVSDNRMASVGGDVAEDDWDDFGVGTLGSRTTKRVWMQFHKCLSKM